MEHQLEWMTEEEGNISFLEEGVPFLKACFFVTGKEEAEFRIQDVVIPKNTAENDNIRNKIILKMTGCILVCFRLLWEEGFEETILVEQNGTELADILDSTDVVQLVYSEFMMKHYYGVQKSTDCGQRVIRLTKTEDGYVCENAEKTFFCRLLTYSADETGESSFYLYEVEVKKKNRNKGIATACLSELFRLLAVDAPVTIYLQVGSYNAPAVHLYKKIGFEVSEELRYYAVRE